MARQEEFQLGAVTHQHMLSQANLESFGRMLHAEAYGIVTGGKARFHERSALPALESVGNDFINRKHNLNSRAKSVPMEKLRANSAFMNKTWGNQN